MQCRALLILIVVLSAACSNPDDVIADDSTTSVVASQVPPTTTAAPITTAAPTTTVPATTTIRVPTPDSYEISSDYLVQTVVSKVDAGTGGLAVDAAGNLYHADFGYPEHVGSSGFMQRITPTGEIESIYRFPSGNAHVVHVDGYLYVTARTDDRVYRYEIATGEVVTVAGTGDEGFADGPGNEATIARPNAIAIGPDGALYINHGGGDGRNDPVWIRKIIRP